MKSVFTPLKQDWMKIPLVLFAATLIVWPEPFVEGLHWIFGISLLVYAAVNFIRGFFFYRKVSYGDCLEKAIHGVIALLLQEDAVPIIGIIWAYRSLIEAGREIDDFLESRHFSIVNAVLILVSIVLSVLLIVHPREHIMTHVRYLGVEIISIVVLSLNNREEQVKEDQSAFSP